MTTLNPARLYRASFVILYSLVPADSRKSAPKTLHIAAADPSVKHNSTSTLSITPVDNNGFDKKDACNTGTRLFMHTSEVICEVVGFL